MSDQPSGHAAVPQAPDPLTGSVPRPRNDVVATVYGQALRMTRFTPADLVGIGVSDADAHACLDFLSEQFLVEPVGEDGEWATCSPARAMNAHASRMEDLAMQARAAAPALNRLWRDHAEGSRPLGGSSGMEILEGQESVEIAMSDLYAGARESLLAIRTHSPRVDRMLAQPPARYASPPRNQDGRELRFRAVFDTDVIRMSDLPEAIRARVDGGDQVRFAPRIPFSATISDTGVVLLDLAGLDGSPIGAWITHPILSEAIRRAMEETWSRAVRWSGSGSRPMSGQELLDQRDRDVLALMLGGATDASVSRQLNISLRTVERRVRRILDALDANTRFEAGAKAAERGWI